MISHSMSRHGGSDRESSMDGRGVGRFRCATTFSLFGDSGFIRIVERMAHAPPKNVERVISEYYHTEVEGIDNISLSLRHS